MSTALTFNEMKEVGLFGEYIVEKELTARGWYVHNVSCEYEYQKKDIDIVAIKGDIKAEIEIKYDREMHKTGNLFIEIYQDLATERKGWYYYSEAEFLFYINETNGISYCFRMDDIRAYCELHREEVKTGVMHEDKLTRVGILLPLKDIQEYCKLNNLYCQEILVDKSKELIKWGF